MPYCDWEDENWDTLIYAIRKNNCILMLGPDAATEAVNGTHRPLTEILANQLAEKIKPEIKKEINPSDLAQISQQYCMEKGRLDLEARVAAFYNERLKLTNDLHNNLAAMPFYFTVTTTPENMFPEALRKEKKEPVIGRYSFKGGKPGKVGMGTSEKPLVFYLYGTVAEPGSLLLTENDLLDFMVALISKKPPLQDNIRIELQNKDKSFLFLGFGFKHWYLRILLHVLQGGNRKSRSFAMEQFPLGSSAELQQNVLFFKRSDYKIHIFKQELNRFAKQLREKFERSSPVCFPRSMDVKTPEVFICHASEDKAYAAQLYTKLEEAGIKPWLDKKNLRGGDDWNTRIEKTIKAVDYFVVLQSNSLEEKKIGYVNREINAALDHQKDFRKGTRFIIPVKIEDCPLREELAHLQTVDLTDEVNIKTLISTIKRDFEKRGS
jgi:hypothetical protein